MAINNKDKRLFDFFPENFPQCFIDETYKSWKIETATYYRAQGNIPNQLTLNINIFRSSLLQELLNEPKI